MGERKLESIAMHYGNKSPQDQRIRKLAEEAWQRNFRKKAEIAVTSQGTWEWGPNQKCQSAEDLWKMLAYTYKQGQASHCNILFSFSDSPV